MYLNMISEVYVLVLSVFNSVFHIDLLKVTAILLKLFTLIITMYYSFIKYPFCLLQKTRRIRLHRRRHNVRSSFVIAVRYQYLYFVALRYGSFLANDTTADNISHTSSTQKEQ